MDPLAVVTMLSTEGNSELVRSALPDAPVLPTADHMNTAARRTRAALAAGLRRLADAVAPPQPTVCIE